MNPFVEKPESKKQQKLRQEYEKGLLELNAFVFEKEQLELKDYKEAFYRVTENLGRHKPKFWKMHRDIMRKEERIKRVNCCRFCHGREKNCCPEYNGERRAVWIILVS